MEIVKFIDKMVKIKDEIIDIGYKPVWEVALFCNKDDVTPDEIKEYHLWGRDVTYTPRLKADIMTYTLFSDYEKIEISMIGQEFGYNEVCYPVETIIIKNEIEEKK